jgi:rRNA-processing protein FCF1
VREEEEREGRRKRRIWIEKYKKALIFTHDNELRRRIYMKMKLKVILLVSNRHRRRHIAS